MRILVNGEATEIQASNIAAVLDELLYEGEALATALNGQFVAREQRQETALQAGDQLEILAPMQGG
ncbi:sulfur carrier protein [Maritalea mobilis]|uniref:Sulfur carrier protein n=1 Tax=Maritalea mobilis TaxID=483324 RepID=A0A4V3DBM3_9HYPH|nr:sulfur carrier protein ThiS [Maritalea mobilis]TDQ67148.1 sulfur carrier protein [Maritalea mobilis]